MTISFIYWFLLLVWLLFNGAMFWSPQVEAYGWRGNGLLLFILFVLIGLHDFGRPIQGM